MKKFYFLFTLIFLFSCKQLELLEEDSYYVEGTLNGTQYKFTRLTEGKYVSVGNITRIQAYDSESDKNWLITFPGNTTGYFENQSTLTIQFRIATGTYYTGNGQLNVTKYENVGGIIEGTFVSTNAKYYLNGVEQPGVYQIFNGSFRVKRIDNL
ncbi:MAG: hypothetical protein ACP5QT_09310 [Brevinematia bacterium]